jgi:hypothetical protein
MKLNEIKENVFTLTCTKSTKQLKKEHPHLTQNSDLRYKSHWLQILEKLKALRVTDDDMSILDLEKSEIMLKESLFHIGKIASMSDESLEIDWQRIKLSSQIHDIHIEEL